MNDRPTQPNAATDFIPESRNPFSGNDMQVVGLRTPIGALANAEQQRSVAEIQARIMLARMNPRDELHAMDLILRDCGRPTLAEGALYQYARGGTSISGPSIRLIEAIASRWGNLASGIKEISRANGYSECIAYAWDMESGYYDDRSFQVRHWRDTKSGGYVLTDERDIYELIANMGQRRKRAVLQTVIPGDVVQAAVDACESTLNANADTSPDAMKRMVTAFEAFGVTRAQIEKRCQCRIDAIRPGQVVQLGKIYASLRDGMSDAKDWFEQPTGAWAEIAERQAAQAAAPAAPKPRGRPPKAPEAPAMTPANPPPPLPPLPSKEAVPEPEEIAASAKPAPAFLANPQDFDEWLLDEHGEPSGDETFTDPVAFARAYEVMWQDSKNRAQFAEENKVAIGLASNLSGTAFSIFASCIEHELNAAAPEPEPEPEAEGPELAIPLAFVRGKPDYATYLRDMRAQLITIPAGSYADFVATNLPTWKTIPLATRTLCVKAAVDAANALNVQAPPSLSELLKPPPGAELPPDPAPPIDPDRKAMADRIADFEGIHNTRDLEDFARGPAINAIVGRLRSQGKTYLVSELLAAYERRKAAIIAAKA